METMATEENHHQHPLMYLHANETATANNTSHVKREKGEPPRENDKEVKRTKSSSKMSSAISIKSIIIAIALFLVIILLHAMLQTYEVIDNKIATSAIILHHCHSFMITCITITSKLLYAIKDIILLLMASSSTSTEVVAMEQFQSRLQKGQQLLAQYNDISGSEMVCKSVADSIVLTANERKHSSNKRTSDDESDDQDATHASTVPLSYSSIISLQLTREESDVLSKSLSCAAEAHLNLFQQQRQVEHLTIAKSYLDNALVIEPTDPLIRANVGLTYLLLGTSLSSGGSDDESVQFVLQSIQHLNVAVGILHSDLDPSGDSDKNSALYMAALHNLGLANLALDGFDEGDHYLQWVNSLQSSEEESCILKSPGLFWGNKGASLLQNDKIDDAIVGLTSFVNEFCSVEDVSEGSSANEKKTKREREACSIVKHNLAIALGHGADDRDKIDFTALIENIAQLDVQDVADETIEEETLVEVESDLQIDAPRTDESSEVGGNNFDDHPGSSNKTQLPDEDSHDDLSSTHVDTKQDVEENVTDTSNEVVQVDAPVPQVKTEMQNALSALEKAAESTQQSRLLLTLAKARVSAGDFSGAVDAALKAISAAKSKEEADDATSYLETIMDKIAYEQSGVVQTVAGDSSARHDIQKESSPARDQLTERHTSITGEQQLSTTELQLRLDLERLKYKVLEQEMRFAQQQVWNHPRNEFAENVKAIDYQQTVSHMHEEIKASPPYQRDVDSENDAHETRMDHKESDDTIPMQNATSVEEANDVDYAMKITKDAEESDASDLNDSSEENATIENDSQEGEQQPVTEVEVEVVMTYGSDPDIIDFDQETIVVKGEEKTGEEEVSDAPEVEEDTSAAVNEEKVDLPTLYSPAHSTPTELSAHAKSYMKMADAYLDKGQYHMASKQFLKVIKKAPDHLPAHLGYATALERDGKSKQISAAALAYGNATRVAIAQGEPVDPLVKAGGGGIAENILRRAMKIAKSAPSERLETLRILSTYAHTAALASDIYYEIGMEVSSSDASSAKEAFAVANELIVMRNDNESRFHIGSVIELGRLALESDNDANAAIGYLDQAKDAHMEDAEHVKLLLLVSRAHLVLGEIEVAISELTRALSLPESPDTKNAHYELAIALSKNNADKHEVDLHFEKALDLGMDPTAEAIEALGERNMSVMRALNRQYYKQFNSEAAGGRSEGGILSGAGVGSQSSSIFGSQQTSEDNSAESDPLSLLEQGASAYDANNVMGGAVEAESNLSNLSNRQAK